MAKPYPVNGLNAHAETRANLTQIFNTRINEVWSWEEHLAYPDRIDELHSMRISAKRLRYCIEFFEHCFSEGSESIIASFRQMQDFLGMIHDCDIWLMQLDAEGSSDKFGPVFENMTQRRERLFAEMTDYWNTLQAENFRDQLLMLVQQAAKSVEQEATAGEA